MIKLGKFIEVIVRPDEKGMKRGVSIGPAFSRRTKMKILMKKGIIGGPYNFYRGPSFFCIIFTSGPIVQKETW